MMIRDEHDLHVPLDTLRQLYLCPTPQHSIISGPLRTTHAMVTGGAGFVGSHLVDRLMLLGATVTVIDDLSTGNVDNIKHWQGNPKFHFIEGDIRTVTFDGVAVKPTVIFHLASPASPPHYQRDPLKTLFTNIEGTQRTLQFASSCSSAFILASTSEVYGDPQVHPQPESYCGNVNTIGPRACYDEGKRVAETITSLYHQRHHVRAAILRIFNTYGPRMQPDDGRVVSNFIHNRLRGMPLQIHGDGNQTRSFQFVHDLIDAFMLAGFTVDLSVLRVVNVGCPDERTIDDFASVIGRMLPVSACTDECEATEYKPADIDDPRRRKPDIARAHELLGWAPRWSLEEGLAETIAFFKLKSVKPL